MRRVLLVLPVVALLVAGCDEVKRGSASATTTQLAAPLSSQAPAPSSAQASPKASASTSGEAATTGLSAFVGEWDGHGRTLVVGEDGSGEISVRTYQKCGDPGVSAPCDTFDGDKIKPGAVTQIKVTATHEDGKNLVAEFEVQQTTLPLPSSSSGQLLLDQDRDVVRIVINGKPGDGTYCGAKAEPGACGA